MQGKLNSALFFMLIIFCVICILCIVYSFIPHSPAVEVEKIKDVYLAPPPLAFSLEELLFFHLDNYRIIFSSKIASKKQCSSEASSLLLFIYKKKVGTEILLKELHKQCLELDSEYLYKEKQMEKESIYTKSLHENAYELVENTKVGVITDIFSLQCKYPGIYILDDSSPETLENLIASFGAYYIKLFANTPDYFSSAFAGGHISKMKLFRDLCLCGKIRKAAHFILRIIDPNYRCAERVSLPKPSIFYITMLIKTNPYCIAEIGVFHCLLFYKSVPFFTRLMLLFIPQ
ncbi:hypothetical protein NEFER03_0780 [Nematocida sp. LUAm3]|nr:hypothetical protein NEFER03_0780 [Nematocida sp. LUAm3]KAI5175239.1 hypothetical protein NEFER02_1200 [Nematocida sp. LUAm2]KAI5178089.1 hypothetical protein NEFER01_1267 [Nematocida sp. LUAm1]